MEYNEHLEYLLLPPGKVKQIGSERGKVVKNGIARFDSVQGSCRYVMYEDGDAVAALQVMDMARGGKEGGHVANVFVKESARRRGLATKLFKEAQKDFQPLSVSDDLSEAGRGWKEKVTSKYCVTAAVNYMAKDMRSYDETIPLQHFNKFETGGKIQWSIQTARTHGVEGLVKVSRTRLEDPKLSLPSSTPGGHTRMAGADNLFLGTKQAVEHFVWSTYPDTKRIKFV